MDEEALQANCFEIISYVGMAKSCYVGAVEAAKAGDFGAAAAQMSQGDDAYNKGHDAHMRLLQADAAGEREPTAPLILLHAEDQMMATETVRLMAENLIDVRRELAELKAAIG